MGGKQPQHLVNPGFSLNTNVPPVTAVDGVPDRGLLPSVTTTSGGGGLSPEEEARVFLLEANTQMQVEEQQQWTQQHQQKNNLLLWTNTQEQRLQCLQRLQQELQEQHRKFLTASYHAGAYHEEAVNIHEVRSSTGQQQLEEEEVLRTDNEEGGEG